MQKIINYIAKKKWGRKLDMKIASSAMIHGERLLPEHLKEMGFLNMPDGWMHPAMKARNKILVKFENNGQYYRLYFGQYQTFVALESSRAFFDWFWMLTIDGPHEYCEI